MISIIAARPNNLAEIWHSHMFCGKYSPFYFKEHTAKILNPDETH